MNRTDRLLAIVIELQAHGRRRAKDLAASFEVGVREAPSFFAIADELRDDGLMVTFAVHHERELLS